MAEARGPRRRQGKPGAADDTVTSLTAEPPPFTRQRGSLVLVVQDGPDAGGTVRIGERAIVVGTDAKCDLVLASPRVSRRHLEVSRRDGGVELVDLGSKNGSFFAGRRFKRLEATSGDEVTVGDVRLRVVPEEVEVKPVPDDRERYGRLVAASAPMRRLFAMIDQVAPTDATVLLEGESGVGKELVAEELHRRSARRDGPFIVCDCGTIPHDLVESTLFGHVRGAFTGAVTDRTGVFEEADGGTVFLDEIGELPKPLQTALLRVLDRGVVQPVGERKWKQVDVRVVAATHRNLPDLIRAGDFREDLYYRLAVVRIAIPPLRARREDVPLLVRHFLQAQGRPDLQLDDAAARALTAHGWPGNVRELRNIVIRGVALARDGRLAIDPATLARDAPSADDAADGAGNGAGATPAFSVAKATALQDFERAYLVDLMKTHGSLHKAADAAGLDRKRLRGLLRRHKIRE